MPEERVFLNDGNMYVSNTKVVLHGTTYSTANITSVSKRFTPASKGCAMIFVAVTALVFLGSLGGIKSSQLGASLIVVLVCGAFLAVGVMWLRSLKPTYHVVLASASGEREGMSSKESDVVDRVIDAITNAITHR